jgi:septum formation protein
MLAFSKKLILASSSPRRARLLRQVGFEFDIVPSLVNEEYNGGEPLLFAREMSLLKGEEVAAEYGDAIVLAADTIVLLNDAILGKPETPEMAIQMLRELSGRMHEVITGFTIIDRGTNTSETDHEITRVRFRELDHDEIDRYVASGSPMDKAGAYGIQDDFGAVFVERIEGCYYNVVGLPLQKVYRHLKSFIR